MNITELFKQPKNQQDSSLDFLPDGIFVLEQDGKIIDVNQKLLEIYDCTRFDFIGKYFSDFVEGGVGVLNEILKTNTLSYQKAITKDTVSSPVLEINTSRDIETGRVYVSVRNATNKQKEQKFITEKYSMAQKIIDEKNEFLLISSGSILSGLVSVSGFSRALLDGIGGALSQKQEKYLNIINSTSRELGYDLEKLFTLFRVESKKVEYNFKNFDLIGLIKSIERVYKKDFEGNKINFSLDYSHLTKRDCVLDSEVMEYILRSIMDIFLRFSTLGKCSLNIGHPPLDFLRTREFGANNSLDCEKYILFEAKITDLVFNQDELDNIFDTYYRGSVKRPIGLKASLNLLKIYITDFGGDIWIYSKPNIGTMFTFVLPIGLAK